MPGPTTEVTVAPEAELTLAGDFPHADEEQWREAVDRVLKGAPFERLVSRTADGIQVEPLYVEGPDDSETGAPGASPFTRGFSSTQRPAGMWDVRSRVDVGDAAVANAVALRELERGAASLELSGGTLADPATLSGALEGVYLDLAPVALVPGAGFLTTSEWLMQLWSERGVPDSDAAGCFGADPIGTLARTGTLPQGLERALADAAGLAAMTSSRYPGVRALCVDATAAAEAGATEGTELATMLSVGAAYLRSMAAAGLTADDAAGQVEIVLGADPDFFTTIAKLRAARRLWATMAEACGVDVAAAPPRIVARTLNRSMSRRDPWVNMLRVTSAAFAAVLGGADTVITLPFDAELGEPAELGRRMARNTQLLLGEESGIGRVLDPAGGSWYVETLTDQLVIEGWSQFRTIEGSGGVLEALKDGSLAARVHRARDNRLGRVATRKAPITGVSEFPNIHEELPEVAPRSASGPVAAPEGTEPTRCEPLTAVRWAQEFEALRDAADRASAAGKPPKVFLANLGSVATHTARASWAKNFFEAGGIEAVTSQRGATDGFDDPESLAADFAESGASMACVCSSDAVYAERAAEMVPALRDAARVYLAGNPGEQRELLEAAGTDEFIHVGVDVLASLRGAHRLLGIGSTGDDAEVLS
jgi:methylmalonyl-CoA mutase